MAEIEKHLPNCNGTLSTTANNLPKLALKAIDTRVEKNENPHRRSSRVISYYCLFCSKSFQDSFERDKHQATHDISKAFECEKCSATFRFKKHLLNHNCSKYVKDKSNNGNPEEKTKYTSDEKILRQYQCQVCLKLFASNANYERHYIGQHSNIKPFACKECGYNYSYADSLRTHQKLEDKHINKGKYPCSYCQKVFTNIKCLTQHQDVSHNIKSASRITTENKRKMANSSSQSSEETNSEKNLDNQSVSSDNSNHQFHFSDVDVENIIEDQHFNDEPVDLFRMENITNSELDEKPFLCNICGQCFIIEASLLIHQESQVCHKIGGRPLKNSVDDDIVFTEKGNWQSTSSQNDQESSNVNPWSTIITINTSNKGLDLMQNNNETNDSSQDSLPTESAKNSTIITINITSQGLDKKQCSDVQKYLNLPINKSYASVTEMERDNVESKSTNKNISQTSTYEKNIDLELLQKRLKKNLVRSLPDKEKSQSSESIPDLLLENFTEKIVKDFEGTPPKLPCYGKAGRISKSSSPIKQSIKDSLINEREWFPKNKKGIKRKYVSSGSSPDDILEKSFENDDSSLFKLPTIKSSMVWQEDFDISSIIDVNAINKKNTAKPQKFRSENILRAQKNPKWKFYSAKYLPLHPESDATRHSPRQKMKNISYEENIIDDMVFEFESENISENGLNIIDDKVKHIAMVKKSLAHFNSPPSVSTGLPMCSVSLQKLSQKEIERYSKSQRCSPLSPCFPYKNINGVYGNNSCTKLLVNQKINPENQDLKCTFCGQEFTHLKFKRSHMAEIHNFEFQCGFAKCNKLFHGRSNLNRHYLGQHIGNIFCCEYCLETFNYRDGLNLHMRTYHREKLKLSCDICYRLCFTQRSLDRHMNHSHSLMCRLCKKEFETLSAKMCHEKLTCLKKSRKFKSRGNVVPSKVLRAVKKKYRSCQESSLQKSPKHHSPLSKFLLPVSNLVLSKEPELVEKIVEETAASSSDTGRGRSIHGDTPSCSFCPNKFNKLRGKYIHERQRSCRSRFKDNFPSVSNENETALPNISNYKTSYPCRFCKEEFSINNEKYKHEILKTCVNARIESENYGEEGDSETSYTSETRSEVSCGFCFKKFKSSVDKRKHENLFHARQKDLIACSFCDQKFRSLNAKSIHIVVAHKGKKTTIKKGKKNCGSKVDSRLRECIIEVNDTRNSSGVQAYFACKFCDKLFSTKQGKSIHETLAHIKKRTVKFTKTETINLVKSDSEKSKFKCKFCGNVFQTFRGKRVHEVLSHCSNKKKSVKAGTSYQTVKINSNVGFTKPETINLVNSDSEESKFECEFCGNAFKTFRGKRTHEVLSHCNTKKKSVKTGTSYQKVTINSNVGLPCRFCEDTFDSLKHRHTHERLNHHREYKNRTEGLNIDSINEQELSDGKFDKSDKSLQNETRNKRRTLSPLKYSEALAANTCSVCSKRFYSYRARATHEKFCKDNNYESTPPRNESCDESPANLSNETSKTSSVLDYNLYDSSANRTNDSPVAHYNTNDSLVQNKRSDTHVVDVNLMNSHVANSNGNDKHENRTSENDSAKNSLGNPTLKIVPVEGESTSEISIASLIRSTSLKPVVDELDPQTNSLGNETSPVLSQRSKISELSEAPEIPSGSVTPVSETSPSSKLSDSDFTCMFCSVTFIYLAGKIYHEKHMCKQNPDVSSEINEVGCEEMETPAFQGNDSSDTDNREKNTPGYKCRTCQNVYENLSDKSLHERSAHFPLEPNNTVSSDKTLPCKNITFVANNELEVSETLDQTGNIIGYSKASNISEVMLEGDEKLTVDNLSSEPCIGSKEISNNFFCKFCKKKFSCLNYKNKHEKNVRCMMVIDNFSKQDQTQQDLLLNVRATPPEVTKNEPVTDFVCKFCNKIFRNLFAKDLHEKIKSCQANSERDDRNDVQHSENSSDGSEN